MNEGIHVALTNLDWQDRSVGHFAFLIGDAPPHLDYQQDFSYAALEAACGAALQLEIYNYHAVRDLLRQGVHTVPARHLSEPSTAGLQHENVRGAAFYAGKKPH